MVSCQFCVETEVLAAPTEPLAAAEEFSDTATCDIDSAEELPVVELQLAATSWLVPMTQDWPVFAKLHLTGFRSGGAGALSGKIA
jgi:hypothetical protein